MLQKENKRKESIGIRKFLLEADNYNVTLVFGRLAQRMRSDGVEA